MVWYFFEPTYWFEEQEYIYYRVRRTSGTDRQQQKKYVLRGNGPEKEGILRDDVISFLTSGTYEQTTVLRTYGKGWQGLSGSIYYLL